MTRIAIAGLGNKEALKKIEENSRTFQWYSRTLPKMQGVFKTGRTLGTVNFPFL